MFQHLGNIIGNLNLYASLNQVRFAVNRNKHVIPVFSVIFKQLDFHHFFLSHIHIHAPLSVGFCGRRICRTGLNPNHVLFYQTFGSSGSFPAAGRTLIQRVLAITKLLDNVLKATAGNFCNAISTCAKYQGGENRQTIRAAFALPNFCLRRLHKTDVADFADFSGINIFRACILMGVNPFRAAHQIVGHKGMDNGHIAVVNGRSVHRFQCSSSLKNQIHRKPAGGVQSGAGLDGCFTTVLRKLGGINNISATAKNFSGQGVQCSARLGAQQFGTLYHIVVNSSQLQHVRQLDIIAILFDFCGNSRYIQTVAIGGHTFGQRLQCFGQRAVLSKFNHLASVGRNGVFVSKLIVNQSGFGQVNEPFLIVGFHFIREVTSGLHSKQLQIQGIIVHTINSLKNLYRVFFRGSERNSLSVQRPSFHFFPVFSAHTPHIRFHHRTASSGKAVFQRPSLAALQVLHQFFRNTLCRIADGLFQNFLMVKGFKSAPHTHAHFQQPQESRVPTFIFQLKSGIYAFQHPSFFQPSGGIASHPALIFVSFPLSELLQEFLLCLFPVKFGETMIFFSS
nr:MAG TPA: hypothetical protein [Caudoviricetes sp.]